MVNLLPVQDSLAYALDHESDCTAKGVLGKVHKFGHEWVEPREKFAVAGYEALIGAVHSLASAIFHTLWALVAGKLFTNKEARTFAVQSWKDLGTNSICALKGLLGIASPAAAKWADKKFQTVHEENEIEINIFPPQSSGGNNTDAEDLSSATDFDGSYTDEAYYDSQSSTPPPIESSESGADADESGSDSDSETISAARNRKDSSSDDSFTHLCVSSKTDSNENTIGSRSPSDSFTNLFDSNSSE